MKYGLIGEKLGHSFSKEIHEAVAGYEYCLKELCPSELESFILAKEFTAINVTIPYKKSVIPYLDVIDEAAAKIGAVNCIVNRDGRLYGYNTDFFGMRALIEKAGIAVSEKTVAILGTGGTSRTARAVAGSLGAERVITVSRTPKGDEISYDELYSVADSIDVIINTTPAGMYPNVDGTPLLLDGFKNLRGVVDAIYNPLTTVLVGDALKRGIPAMTGLYMLVAQAVRAIEIFQGKSYGCEIIDTVYEKIRREKENIVLIGMPSSGKSSIGRYIADALGRELYDTDEEIVKASGMAIPEIFEKYGEAHFRELERLAVSRVSKLSGVVIATGGGAILKAENVRELRKNGRIYFIDRPLADLLPTADRPLSSTREQIEKRYNERYQLYKDAADLTIDGQGTVSEVAERILGERK